MLNVINNILKTGTYGEGGGNPSQSGPSGGEGGNPEPPRGPRPPYHYAGNNPEGDKENKKYGNLRKKELKKHSKQVCKNIEMKIPIQ